MKYRFSFLLCLLLTLTAGAETVQIPVTLRNDRVKSGNSRLFSVVLPLAPGALRDLKNLKLSDADGVEIASQSRLLLRHASGDAAWVKVSGLIDMGRRRSRKIFVEYGSDVLNSARRGIVHAVNGSRMLIDAGVISAEFALDRFALPDKVMVNGKLSGSFAPLPSSLKSASVSIIESGALHTVVAVTVPEQPELGTYRVHFYYDLPEIRVEFFPGRANGRNPVKFAGGKIAPATAYSGRYWVTQLDFSGETAEIKPELTGIVPAWHLERAGVLPGNLPEYLKNFEQTIVADVKEFPGKYLPETLLEVFFRTGDLQLLKLAVDSPLPLSDRTGGTLLRAFGSSAVSAENTPISADITGGVVLTSGFIQGVEAFLQQKISCENALRLGEILASGFDLNSGNWFKHIAVSGGAAAPGDHVGTAWRIRGLLCMMKLEALTRDRRFARIIDAGLRRVTYDYISEAFRQSARQFELLTPAAEFYRRYPEYSSGMSRHAILQRFADANTSPLRFRLLPGMSVELLPESSGAAAIVTAPASAELAVCDRRGVKQFSANGAPEMLIPLSAAGTLLKYSGRGTVDCSVKFSGKYRTGLPLGKNPLELKTAQFLKFSLELPADCRNAELRISPLIPGEWAELYLISSGTQIRHRVPGNIGAGIFSVPPVTLSNGNGIWQVFVHVSQGGAAISLEGADGMLWR